MSPRKAFPRTIFVILLLMAALTVLSACGGDETPTPLPTATAVTILPTSTPLPAADAQPAAESRSAAAPATDTPAPAAPVPTETPSAPTNTPEPLPPLLLESSPAQGSAWDGGPVRFIFDQPLACLLYTSPSPRD